MTIKVMNINSTTALYGVFGNPVSHSLSPVMHNQAFACTGINAVYLAFRIDDIAMAVSGVKALGIQGVSVTLPHKVSVMDHLDDIDPAALRIGAVNTIVNLSGRLKGYNTDSLGAIAALNEKTQIEGRKVVIIGAGGAARAIGDGIMVEGGKLTVVNRSIEKGEKLAVDLGADFLPLAEFSAPRCDIMINTTSLGMTPNTDSTPVKEEAFAQGMVVMDIVYNPLKTRFLQEAERKGCTIIDGVAMFVYQGALQFEMWTGRQAPTDVMRNVVVKELLKNQAEIKGPNHD